MHFQSSLSLWELQVIRDWLCVRVIAETYLNRLLLFLILKSSHRSYSVGKGVLKNFTGKHFCWSLFLTNFFCLLCMKCLSKCFCSKKPVLLKKIPGWMPVTLNLTFHLNFHPNIWVFANLPIYSKLIHDNISLVFSKLNIFCLISF